jgi:uncharacterized repeat protein (TIGR01451 family)
MCKHLGHWYNLIPVLLLTFLFQSSVFADKPAAGTSITNRAEISWFDTADGLVKKIYSNVAQIVVAEQITLALEEASKRKSSAGQPIHVAHRVINTGNLASSYEVRVKNNASNTTDLERIKVYKDIDGNGAVSAGEPELESIACQPAEAGMLCYQIPLLDPNEIFEFVISGKTSITAQYRDIAVLDVAVMPTGRADLLLTKQDTINVLPGANIGITKVAAPACGSPIKALDTIKYRINFTNSGDSQPTGRMFKIDIDDLLGVVLEDIIPPNLHIAKTPVPVFAPSQAILLVQLKQDEDTPQWTRFANWNGTDVISKLGLYLPSDQMQKNQSGKLEFEATAELGLTTSRIYNQVTMSTDIAIPVEFASNRVCSTLVGDVATALNPTGSTAQVVDNDAKIRFLIPTIERRRNSQIPDFFDDSHFEDATYYSLDKGDSYSPSLDGVYIEVHSSALNNDEDLAEFRTVVVTSSSGDTMEVFVKETAPNSGVFRSIRPIRLVETDTVANKVCPTASTNIVYNSTTAECTLKAGADGRLDVTITDLGIGATLSDDALIDPLGIVFDAAFDIPLAGAIVTVRNADGTLATDPLSPTLSPYEPQTTGADGRYQFPFLFPNQQYYIDVIPPENSGYTFPSTRTPAEFISRTVNQFSYGENGISGLAGSGVFTLTELLIADIPLDPDTRSLLTIEKTSGDAEVSIGDFITYTIEINNNTIQNLFAVTINDVLPYGFRYVSNTTFLDGQLMADPIGAPGPNLTFSSNLQFLAGEAPGVLDTETHKLTYRVRVTAGAMDSDGINTANATGRTETSLIIASNTTKARVAVSRTGVLSDSGIIFGKIYVDANCSDTQREGEWPIGGVKLYMEDGTWVITDGNGQYSLYGIRPGNHVIKIDPITLPEGLTLKPLDNRHMADPDSRLVDLVAGEFHRADFAASCPKDDIEAVYARVKARNTGKTDWMLDNAQKYDPEKVNAVNDLERKTGADGDLSNGMVGFSQQQTLDEAKTKNSINRGYSLQTGQHPTYERAEKALAALPEAVRSNAFIYPMGDLFTVRIDFALQRNIVEKKQASLEKQGVKTETVATIYERLPLAVLDRLESPADAIRMPRPQEVAKSITRAQAKSGTWLWPKDNTSLDGRFMVVVKAGVKPTLKVNGKVISKAQIGERIENKREKSQIVAWYGVALKAGKNKLEVVAKDAFGNNRLLAKGTFKRPTKAVKITMTPLGNELSADGGRSYLPVKIKIVDVNGYPARGVHFVTLESSDGSWVERDIQDQTRGKQVRVTNGERIVHLRSSEYTGEVKLHAYDGELKAEGSVNQTVPLRPLMAVGLIDITGKSSRFSSNSADRAPASEQDTSVIDARAAIFIKGRIKGNAHVTLSYDSDKETNGERFRDINPNSHYPLYGDDSQRGYEAQSRSKVYAKLEKGKNSVMWGDYLTDSQGNDDVARVQRSLTGVNGVVDNGKTRVQMYASRPEDNHITEEIRGQGTALNYHIGIHPIIRNSEVVEMVTYSRDSFDATNESGVAVYIRQLTRFSEYHLDHLTGELSFTDSIPFQDDDANPVFIRITYDVENDGKAYTVAGARIDHQLSEALRIGASYLLDEHTTTGKNIAGISAEYKKDDLRVAASAATMKHQDTTKKDGEAVRLAVEKKWNPDANTVLRYGRAGIGYDNASGGISAGREEAAITHKQRINDTVSVNVEGLHSKDQSSDAIQQSIGITSDIRRGEWTLKGGVRHIEQKNSADNDSLNTVIVGAKRPIDIAGRKGNISAEYEQDIGNRDRKRVALGSDLQVHDKISVYGRAERINSLSGVSGLSSSEERDTLSLGIKSDVMENTSVYSEYRLRGAIDSRDMEAASGIRGTYEVKKGLSLSPRVELVTGLKGATNDSVAVSLGVKDVRDTNSRKLARLEARHDDTRDYYGAEGTYVSRIDERWGALVKDTLRVTDPSTGTTQYSNVFSVGLASRPRTDNKHNMLFLYQNKEERGFDDGDCSAHVLSTHQNYETDKDKTISGRVAGKTEKCEKGGISSTSEAVLLDGRYIWDVTNRWDVDLHGGVLATNRFGEKQYSIGLGANYLVRKNLRVGIGYNVKGFAEDDLDSEGYNKQGVYAGLQYKFDEKDFAWATDKDDGSVKPQNDDDNDEGLLSKVKNWFK